mmetsp:Transcript_18136/g.32475  ORF Transcript_18136/g.32475 Transcript_18136/m.32475 type:complete len:214 (+) Transcript_18136:3296-3937(+)
MECLKLQTATYTSQVSVKDLACQSNFSSRASTPKLSARYTQTEVKIIRRAEPSYMANTRNVRNKHSRRISSENFKPATSFEDVAVQASFQDYSTIDSNAERRPSRASVPPTRYTEIPKRSPFRNKSLVLSLQKPSPCARPNSVFRARDPMLTFGSEVSNSMAFVCPNVISTKTSPKRSYKSLSKLKPHYTREVKRRPSNFVDFCLDAFIERRR